MADILKYLPPFLAACCVLLWGAYSIGYDKASAESESRLHRLQVEWTEQRRHNAEAYGKALAEAYDALRAEAERADETATRLARDNQTLSAQAAQLRRQVKNAASGNHIFSVQFVRLFNQAIGALPTDTGEHTADPRHINGIGTGGTAADSGLLSGVNEADLLAYMLYYGGRCQRLEQKDEAWRGLAKGWQGGSRGATARSGHDTTY